MSETRGGSETSRSKGPLIGSGGGGGEYSGPVVGPSERKNEPKYLGPRPKLVEVEPITRRHKPESGAESDSTDPLTRLLAWEQDWSAAQRYQPY
jgi:hypothetical protein